CLARQVAPEVGGDVVGGLLDLALAPEVVVEGVRDALLTQAEEHMDAGRLNVRVDNTDAFAPRGQHRGDIGADVRLPGSAAKRVDGDDLRHSVFSGCRRSNPRPEGMQPAPGMLAG